MQETSFRNINNNVSQLLTGTEQFWNSSLKLLELNGVQLPVNYHNHTKNLNVNQDYVLIFQKSTIFLLTLLTPYFNGLTTLVGLLGTASPVLTSWHYNVCPNKRFHINCNIPISTNIIRNWENIFSASSTDDTATKLAALTSAGTASSGAASTEGSCRSFWTCLCCVRCLHIQNIVYCQRTLQVHN